MRKTGTTMVEAVVAIAIFIIASLIITALFISHTKLFSIEETVGALKLQKALFARQMRQTAESAVSVIPSMAFGGISYISSTSTIILKLPAINANDEMINGTYDYIVFYKEGADLFMQTSADAASQRKNIKQKLAESVHDLVFRYDTALPQDTGAVDAYLHLQNNNIDDEISLSIYLRNKNR